MFTVFRYSFPPWSLTGFKKESREGFLKGYGAFVCSVRGCYVCGREGARREAGQEPHNVEEEVLVGGGGGGGGSGGDE